MGIGGQLLLVLAFVAAVAAVFAAAAWEILRIVRERLLLAPAPGLRRLLYRRVVLATAALGVLCIAWGRFVEPFWPEVTRVRIESAKVRPGTRPLRIIHVSDLHVEAKPRLEERIPGLVAAEKPDLIVFTGDSLNSPAGLKRFRGTMQELARIAPTYGVRGNWDVWYWHRLDLFGGTGAEELDRRSVRLDVAGTPVRLAGCNFADEPDLDRAVRGADPAELLVFLYHTPDVAFSLAKREVDLFLAGHTHGGQVALPFFGAIITFSRFGRRFARGLHEIDGMRVYVNRGIGMEGHRAPRVRFCARPEITVLEIAPR
jgi:predicted MPP superfamily phosphohydrolase